MSAFSKFLVGLALTTVLAVIVHLVHRDAIAENLRVSAQKILDDNYLNWAKISFKGEGLRYRIGVIEGAAPNAESVEAARKLVLDQLSNHKLVFRNSWARFSSATDDATARTGAMRVGGVHDVIVKVTEAPQIAQATPLPQPVPEPAPAAEPAPAPAPEVDKCKADIAAAMENNKVNFETGSATVAASSQALLDTLAGVAAECPTAKIAIGGHTDQRGSEAANLKLSQSRADSVKAYLEAKGVAADRLSATGYGESRPLDPAETPEAYGKNRRIEFEVTAGQ